ncbi:hypothetical protein [Arcicella rosea]|uniref:Uncharacterized protein n=1 Tax=Arcicella rosea TaxID=502909 RepID=A0A841EKC7_9BACT|nr:hypothetical protein [Arcicella rosea]MBB6004002.1 hypothetical protein [Arcicella rosea]
MKNIEEEIAKTLESIENIQPVASNPFLYAKIKHRMNKLSQPTIVSWLTYAKLAICMIIVGFNIITFSKIYLNEQHSVMSKEEFGTYLGITTTQNLYEP